MIDTDYIISIDKETLGHLPVMTFPGEITVVDTPSVAHTALRALSRHKVVGFDTETRPSFRKGTRHKVALMQISTGDRCFLFRLNVLGISSELRAFLQNPSVTKVGLSLHDDFAAISRSEEFHPEGFVDLQAMVKEFGFGDISLQKIFAIVFGERISKGQRLSNWEAETLTEAQKAYAALDAWACLRLYYELTGGHFNPLYSPYRHKKEIQASAGACTGTNNEYSPES
ncbi:MAG: 3'-5' exonuclease domain-containing protein 2 [Muribaculaceae bacterium]|jgi:ribonuclease D